MGGTVLDLFSGFQEEFSCTITVIGEQSDKIAYNPCPMRAYHDSEVYIHEFIVKGRIKF